MRLTKLRLIALLLAGCTAVPEPPPEAPEPTPAGSGAQPFLTKEEKLSPDQENLDYQFNSVLDSLENGQINARLAAERLEQISQVAFEKGFLDQAVKMRFGYANLLRGQGNYKESIHVLLGIRKIAQDNRLYTDEAGALNQMGQILGPKLKQWEKALKSFEDAWAVYFESPPTVSETVLSTAGSSATDGYLIFTILGNIGMCQGRLGNFEMGEKRLLEAIDLQRQLDDQRNLHIRWGELANVYFLEADYARAVEAYKTALDILGDKVGPAEATWFNNLAIALTEAEDWPEAERFHGLAHSLGIADQPGSQAYWSWAAGRIAASKGLFDEAEKLYVQAIQQGRENPAIQWSANADLGRLLAPYNWERSRRRFGQAIALIDQAQKELLENENRIFFFSRLIRLFQDYVEILVEHGEEEEALRIVESSRARILTGKLDLASPDPLPAIDYRNLAQPGTAYLSYWLAPQASYLWMVSQSEVKLFELPPKDEIEQRVGRYSEEGEWDTQAGNWLYDRLLSPAKAQISAMDRIVVIPDGALHFLNFETLPMPDSQGCGSPCYFIEEEAAVSVAPSLYSSKMREEASPASENSLLLFGNPVRPGDPPLPHAEDEISFISELFDGWQLLSLQQNQATPRSFLDLGAKDGFRLIHIASHAVDNPSNPLQSYISLSPEPGGESKLYARDLLSGSSGTLLQADLVTLSACGTAGRRALGGEGLVGLSWAFLLAGARHVVATLWEAGDKAAFEIMKVFYRRVQAGEPYDQALRHAKLRLVRLERGNLHKPQYWGAFQLHAQPSR